MGKGGHNRLPRAVKELRGTLDSRTAGRPDAPAPRPCKVPKAPRGLSPAERGFWRELAEQVEHLGVYTPADYSAFRLMVRLVACAHDTSGAVPASALTRAMQAANTALASFGLTPASRERVPRAPGAAGDATETELFERPSLAPRATSH